jgi:uncharacterized membrane protein YcaP (DUF421 family)
VGVFYNDLYGLIRILIVGILAYVSLIVFLRLSGKRTLSKMNAFDLVVTVALGSTLATVLLSREVALLEGLLAFAILIGLQFGIAALSVRYDSFEKLVKAEPTLLFHKDVFMREAMRRERVTEEEVRSVVRQQGNGHIEQVEAVVLETDGSFSTVSRQQESKSPSPERPTVRDQEHSGRKRKDGAMHNERREVS